jgi:hypothetical protein
VLPWVASLLNRPVAAADPALTTVPLAYPLEPAPPAGEAALAAACAAAGVRRFGRFAEWRYVDLHELAWGAG